MQYKLIKNTAHNVWRAITEIEWAEKRKVVLIEGIKINGQWFAKVYWQVK